MMRGSGPDLRDGDPVTLRGLGRLEAYRQPGGNIAIWDGQHHVMIPPDGSDLRVAKQQLRLAAEWRKGRD